MKASRSLLACAYLVLACAATSLAVAALGTPSQSNRVVTMILSTEGIPPALLTTVALALYMSRKSHHIWRNPL